MSTKAMNQALEGTQSTTLSENPADPDGKEKGKNFKKLPPNVQDAYNQLTRDGLPPNIPSQLSPDQIASLLLHSQQVKQDAESQRSQGIDVSRGTVIRENLTGIADALGLPPPPLPKEEMAKILPVMGFIGQVGKRADQILDQGGGSERYGHGHGHDDNASIRPQMGNGGPETVAVDGKKPQAVDIPEAVWPEVERYSPQYPDSYIKQSQFKRGRGDNKGAFRDLSRGIKNTGGTSDLYYQRGHVAANVGDHEQAAADAAKALDLDPSNEQALVLYKLSQDKVSSVKIDPDRPDFGSRTLLASAELPGAGAAGGAAGGAADGAASRVMAGRPAASIQYGSTPEQRSNSLVKEAVTAMRVKDYRTALKKAEAAAAANPRNAGAYNVQAAVHLHRKDFRAAAEAATRGLELAPKNVPLLNTRALTWNHSKSYRKGLRDAAAAVSYAPRSGAAYFNLAYARTGLGRRAEGLGDLKRAAHLDPRFQKAYETALQLPDEEDSMFLFEDALSGSLPAGHPAPKGIPLWPFLLVGAVLLGFGAFHVLKPAAPAPITAPAGYGDGSVYNDDPDSIPPDGFWNKYMVTREIAAGGMGIVYEAVDRGLDRKVAIKKMRDEIRDDRRERERFLGEAKTVAKMKHPNIVEIYAIEEDGDDVYLVFEYVEGKTLYEAIHDKGRLTVREALPVFKGVCEALEYAHLRNIIHRDLKTANIMVEDDGRPKVMDFGIAKVGHDPSSKTATIIGTPLYMSPEQEEGIVRKESDVYALGICLYEALGAAMPFQGTPGAVLLSKREAKYQRLNSVVSDIPEAVSAVIDRALHPNPEKRIKTPMQFYGELVRAAGS